LTGSSQVPPAIEAIFADGLDGIGELMISTLVENLDQSDRTPLAMLTRSAPTHDRPDGIGSAGHVPREARARNAITAVGHGHGTGLVMHPVQRPSALRRCRANVRSTAPDSAATNSTAASQQRVATSGADTSIRICGMNGRRSPDPPIRPY
jgi:hypothetical protein